jgi:hypothetical protein
MWQFIPMSDRGGSVCIDGLYGLLSINTRPDEAEWRITWFNQIGPVDHVAITSIHVAQLISNGFLAVDGHWVTMEMQYHEAKS